MSKRRQIQVRTTLFKISVAAERSGVHPQTLRIYEQKGLIKPQRSEKQTRLYSMDDVERVQTIYRLSVEQGLGLRGAQIVLALQEELERTRRQLNEARRELAQRRK